MTIDRRPIGDFMTPSPHTIGLKQSLAEARARMEQFGIRHLPVLDGGELRGILTERDIALVLSTAGEDASAMTAEDAMTPDPYTVGPEAPLQPVIQELAEKKYGAAIVVDGARVAGLLTVTDAMHLLSDLLAAKVGFEPRRLMPSEVRSRIRSDHAELRKVFDEVTALATKVKAGETRLQGRLRERCREVYGTLLRHMELEDAILAPALRETDSFGPVREQQLRDEHAQQRGVLARALSELDNSEKGAAALAQSVVDLMESIRQDMEHEDADLLNENLLKDDVINAGIFGG